MGVLACLATFAVAGCGPSRLASQTGGESPAPGPTLLSVASSNLGAGGWALQSPNGTPTITASAAEQTASTLFEMPAKEAVLASVAQTQHPPKLCWVVSLDTTGQIFAVSGQGPTRPGSTPTSAAGPLHYFVVYIDAETGAFYAATRG